MALEIINSDVYEDENTLEARYVDKFILVYRNPANKKEMKVVAVCDNQRRLINYRTELETEYRKEHASGGTSPYYNFTGHQTCPDLGGIFIP
jgi:hypothetical protein